MRLRAVVLALACGLAAHAQSPPTLSLHVERDEVSVGEPFRVELRGSGPAGTSWSFPERAGNDDVELVRETPTGTASPAPPDVATYRAAVFSVKDVAIPPLSARWRLADGSSGEASTASRPLQLRSLLPKDEKERVLGDVHAPVALDVGWPFWATLAGALVALAALAFWFARRRRRPTGDALPATPAVPPDVEALRALDALAASEHLARGEWRPFYIALAEVAKRYLERRLGAPVLEMTSTETLAFLRGHAHGDALLGTLRDVMGAADQVKFARGASQSEEAARHLAATRGLIARLEAQLAPVAPRAGEAP